MSDRTELVQRYLAAWNATVPAERDALIAETFTETAGYTDPMCSVRGHAALGATIAAVQDRFAGLEFTLAGPVDAHHELVRFSWHLGRPGGAPLVVGFDVAEVAEDGRITAIHGFLDQVPA